MCIMSDKDLPKFDASLQITPNEKCVCKSSYTIT
jgi:hypothetical protein